MTPWTVPNIITMGRIVLIIVFGVLLVSGNDGWAIAALAVAGISDFLDGFLARRLNQRSELGRILGRVRRAWEESDFSLDRAACLALSRDLTP